MATCGVYITGETWPRPHSPRAAWLLKRLYCDMRSTASDYVRRRDRLLVEPVATGVPDIPAHKRQSNLRNMSTLLAPIGALDSAQKLV